MSATAAGKVNSLSARVPELFRQVEEFLPVLSYFERQAHDRRALNFKVYVKTSLRR